MNVNKEFPIVLIFVAGAVVFFTMGPAVAIGVIVLMCLCYWGLTNREGEGDE